MTSCWQCDRRYLSRNTQPVVPNPITADSLISPNHIANNWYDDVHGRAATTVLNRTTAFETRSVDLDTDFPLDDGENAAVSLANELDAALLLCDEFNQLGLIHASLADTRLVTTPTLFSVFVRINQQSVADARTFLDGISDARSWSANSYVQRARSVFEDG